MWPRVSVDVRVATTGLDIATPDFQPARSVDDQLVPAGRPGTVAAVAWPPAFGSFPAAISRTRVGPHQISDSTAPSKRTAAAVQNGAIGANVNNEPALIEPSA